MVFSDPGASTIMYGLAPAVLFVTLSTVPMALLRRGMRFKALAVQSLVAGAAGEVIAIVLALAHFGLWALIAQAVLDQFAAASLYGSLRDGGQPRASRRQNSSR